jgi:predicted nucleotidyltransferase component of viral defense system
MEGYCTMGFGCAGRTRFGDSTSDCRNVFGLRELPYTLKSSWYSSQCNVTGYELEELLATKFRALYQRQKGRDLFDLYWALTQQNIDIEKLIYCYKLYVKNVVNTSPTQKQFLASMNEKMSDKDFREDIYLLLEKAVEYDIDTAWELVRKELVEKI